MNRLIEIPEECQEWTDSIMVQAPIKEKDLKEPTVLVRRIIPDVDGPRGEQLMYLPGFPTISLFTGCGGFDVGTEQAGFTTLVQHEMDKACCDTLIANRPTFFRHSALIQGDIRKTPTSMILREAGLRVGEAYMITGGPPCQGFSTSSSKALQHIDDDRNDLVFEYLRVVREAKPHFFMFENVPGIFNFQKGKYFRAMLDEAYKCYYELVYGLIDCVEYGVPQRRVRFICMGTRRDIADCDGILASLPQPQCFAEKDRKTLKSALKYTKTHPLLDEDLRRIMRAPGIRYFPDRPILVPPRPCSSDTDGGGFAGRSKTFLDFYDKLEREEPDRLVRQRGDQ